MTSTTSTITATPFGPQRAPDDSVRDLNRLLESALRMGGEDKQDSGTYSDSVADDTASSHVANNGNGSNNFGTGAALCRLHTARQLGLILSSELRNGNNSNTCENKEKNPLLPAALKRQSRYWVPLLLSWIRQDGGVDDIEEENSFESAIPLTTKQRRQRLQQQSLQISAHKPQYQIEALRTLTFLTEWTAKMEENKVFSYNGSSSHSSSSSSSSSTQVTVGCSCQSPLSTHSQKLLLRHADAVPMIIYLLSSPEKAVHEQAMWILGSIASGGLETSFPPLSSVAAAVSAAIKYGDTSLAVPLPTTLLGKLSSTPLESLDEAKDLRGKEKGVLSAREAVLAAGAMEPILECLDRNPQNVELHRIGVWCLSSLIEGRYSNSSATSQSANNDSSGNTLSRRLSALNDINVCVLLPTLRRMLQMDDWEILTFTCWTLSHICDGPAPNINAVLYSEYPIKKKGTTLFSPENGLVPRLIELLFHPSPKVVKPALRTIGNIVCAECTDNQHTSIPDYTEVILEMNALPFLRDLVCHENREIQKEACWTLSNIAAGTISQIQAVIDSGVIPPLVDLVNNQATDKEVRSEACWVVLNATSCGSDGQIERLVEEGCVSVLGVLLSESSMVMMALEGLERVLQTEEAKDIVEFRSIVTMNGELCVGLAQRQTTLRCAALIKSVTELPHNSSAVTKRARRIWDTHFVGCALCHGSFSRHRINDYRFCLECKCHVCSQCDCRVYHLSYQEELWAEDDDKADITSKNAKSKKNKKQKKKARVKKKTDATPKVTNGKNHQVDTIKTHTETVSKRDDHSFLVTEDIFSKLLSPSKEPYVEYRLGRNDVISTGELKESRKTMSSSPSRQTIDDDSASMGTEGGVVLDENENSLEQPPIDLVLYLQQTGSIIALAKLMDSLYYDEEYV